MNIYGIIMAGGGGTRFWPLSRKSTPKQLLNLSGKDVMVNEAIDRLASVAPRDNIFIVTNRNQKDKMQQVTAGRIVPDHILSEPSARNTAACIGYAAIKLLKTYGDGIMVITPSDAYIKNNAAFTQTLNRAIKGAEEGEHLVTIGIEPTFPATGYGYIQYEESKNEAKPVKRFVEKPSFERAVQYLAEGGYVWNSGMFIWKISVILEQFRLYLPDIYEDLMKIGEKIGLSEEEETLSRIYPEIRSVSVDVGIMEKAQDILVVPGEFGWSDVGSWDMLGVLHSKDEGGNVSVGNVVQIDAKDSVFYSSGKLVAAVGVENLIVVETPDAVLVCPKDKAQDVKKMVDRLKSEGKEELL